MTSVSILQDSAKHSEKRTLERVSIGRAFTTGALPGGLRGLVAIHKGRTHLDALFNPLVARFNPFVPALSTDPLLLP
jgi:hypothetical protein